jgi:2-polyprenyl-3-methyl-5-hydroxy-6-metoxy-1,4-benzoquinol methylase
MPPFTALVEYFDWVAAHDGKIRRIQGSFHTQLSEWHQRKVPAGSRVLEWGCGAGDLLDSLKPGYGLGLDLSAGMVEKAAKRYGQNKNLVFRQGDVHTETISEPFDYIVLSYLTGYLTDIEQALRNLHAASHARTRLVVTSLNNFWLWPLRWAQWLGLVTPQPQSNWLSTADLVNLLELAGWEVVEKGSQQWLPFNIPLLTPFLNRFVARLPGFRSFGITLTIIARPAQRKPAIDGPVSCSVIVPARNEAGNIRAALARIPVLGHQTEIVFVEGNSTDDTWDVIQREIAAYTGPHRVTALKQPGRGKWDAVCAGFAAASGDVLVIQDADLTAPPEDLAKFYEAIASGVAEFCNGSRLVYPMEKQAMPFLNFMGNKFFALALSYVLGQPIKDSLCGTKMMLRSDHLRITQRIAVLGDFDPFGDFNLLFGASLLSLRIRDIPVRYKDRTYGQTNISRFKHGWLLLKMTVFGLFKIRWS